MKKQLTTISAACAATLAIFAASDLIDIFDKAGSFVSVMVDDIEEITVGKDAPGQDGYSTVNVQTATGLRTRMISEISDIKYTPVDYDKANEIVMADAPNARVVLYDWRNNTDYYGEAQIDPTKPADWRGCPPDRNPHFLIDTDKGFASEFAVKGLYSGKVYTDNPNFIFWSPAEMNLLGIDSYSFDMPFEPVEISAISVELETYKDREFLGDYTGFIMSPGDSRIVHKMPATLSAEFRANGTYVMNSTDDYEFDFLDLFDWDEAKNTFEYVPYTGRPVNPIDLEVKTGVTGQFADGGILFATFHDILNDKPETSVHYFAAKGEYEFTIASADEFNNHLLLQAKPIGEGITRYFIVDYYSTPTEVVMEYSFGNNIGGNCTAFALANGEKLLKYDYKGQGYDPVFTFRGAEYGTYTGVDDLLTLDGFGSCTYGDANGSYTITGGLANVTIGETTRLFVLDPDTNKYTEMVADTWTGQKQYTNDEATGSFRGATENSDNFMRIDFDKNFAGEDEPGTASVRFSVARNNGFGNGTDDLVSSSGHYIYNAESKMVIITNLYMGYSATNSGRRNLILKVSEDMLSVWIDDTEESRVYGTGRDGSYLLTGTVNTLTAPAPTPTVTLAPKYTGTPSMLTFGNPAPTETTLTINEDNTATLHVTGMGYDVLNSTVPYTLEGNTLTLAQVTTYTNGLMPEETKTDIVFTVGEDGSLTSEQTVGGAIMSMFMYVDIDFSTSSLTPEGSSATITLAPKYTGTPNMLAFGNPAPTETTLTINEDNTATLHVTGMGYDVLNSTVPYTLEGNTLTLAQVTTYTNGLVPEETKTDIVFTVGEDGTLTSEQTVGGAIMSMFMYVDIDFSTSSLAPTAE